MRSSDVELRSTCLADGCARNASVKLTKEATLSTKILMANLILNVPSDDRTHQSGDREMMDLGLRPAPARQRRDVRTWL